MKLDNKIINVAIQVLPMSNEHDMYDMVDSAIELIQKSGLKYKVTPFETVVEGVYSEVMQLVQKVQEACYESGAQKLLCNLKIQSHSIDEVTIEDKIGKYEA
ncbi:thiamine-binding protein [Carboxylicivirga sp. M1479]|uniref:thiamine-binding protein n=1 Tax=Carboxylicivirga sp. M1479 TaxID=2594476 RepID=UPI0011773626|nr:thiamine-binding protein [Carboxylicivirga sp. M1479]TRX70743.1 thiamine-binding protein [Carboxylicivirga sp. M1479]